MNVRFVTLAGACLAFALAACGGGATGNIPNGPPPTVGPTGQPTSPPTGPPTAPPTTPPGTSLNYAGTLTQTNTYKYPEPSPFPGTSTTAQVTNVVAVSAAKPVPPLSAPAAAEDYRATETDAYPLQSVLTTTDSWEADVTTGASTKFLQYATNVATNGNASTASTIGTQYSAPQILDEIPETNGTSWTNTNGGTVNETDADGTTDKTTRSANGTYTDLQRIANTTATLTIAVNADGSGSYGGSTFPLIYGFDHFAFSKPSGGKITIAIIATPAPAPTASATPEPTAPPHVIATPAAWFASGAPLYADKTTVATGVSFPSVCNVPAQFGTSGNALTRKIASYDPVLGFTDAQTMITYVAGAGPVCERLNDLQTTYYDYLNDTQKAWDNLPISKARRSARRRSPKRSRCKASQFPRQ